MGEIRIQKSTAIAPSGTAKDPAITPAVTAIGHTPDFYRSSGGEKAQSIDKEPNSMQKLGLSVLAVLKAPFDPTRYVDKRLLVKEAIFTAAAVMVAVGALFNGMLIGPASFTAGMSNICLAVVLVGCAELLRVFFLYSNSSPGRSE